MFKSRTVFVIGAGASNELGLPVGSILRDNIVKKVGRFPNVARNGTEHGDYALLERLAGPHREHIVAYEEAGLNIQKGIYSKNSIDEFLEWNRHDKFVAHYGKAAIAKCILEAEQDCRKQFFDKEDYGYPLRTFNDNWYGKFFSMLTSGRTMEEDAGEIFQNVTFVIFNYDRCLQNYLATALQALGLTRLEAERLCSEEQRFLHIYGSVGPLFGEDSVPFGLDPKNADVGKLASNIRVYTDARSRDDIVVDMAQAAIESAETLVFLGFFYNERNLDMLKSGTRTDVRRIFGTALHRSEPDIDAIRKDLADLLWKRPALDTSAGLARLATQVRLTNETCSKFFDTFSASLTRSAIV